MSTFLIILGLVGAQETVDTDFFERRIRPVLVERCYRCHNSAETSKGRLALDSRDATLEGGRSGPAVVPGRPEDSLLIKAIRHEAGAPRMPKDEPKLSPSVVADFVEWIRRGAVDPRDQPPSAEDIEKATSWEALREERKKWWSFQPIRGVTPPPPSGWSDQIVDRFVFARMEAAGLSPSTEADRFTLLRRVTFVLTGLPPTREEIEAFARDDAPGAYERVVDRLLASRQFGERWARHWMDLFRYAESHGSEGDPGIPYAWRYRDYLIRALNADVPYDRLILEHVAGDLLEEPRVDLDTGVDESAVGTAHFRFVQHGYAPTDALDEQVRFTDNQIDVISKAFLGLTVSCSRCHDHKFDPISQRDFYALYGILTSSRPALRNVDGPQRRARNREALAALKPRLREALAAAWLRAADDLPERLRDAPRPSPEPKKADRDRKRERPRRRERNDEPKPPWQEAVDDATRREALSPLYPWLELRELDGEAFTARWNELAAAFRASRESLEKRNATYKRHWALGGTQAREWHPHGNGLQDGPVAAGEFSIPPTGDRVVDGVYPAGVYTHLLSTKHSGVITSPRFPVDTDSIWIRAFGGAGARARYAMQHYPRVTGPVYKSHGLSGERPRWLRWDMVYWKGDHAYLELATAADLPIEARDEPRSWWGVTEVVMSSNGQEAPRDEPAEFTAPLFVAAGATPPSSLEDLARLYRQALRGVVARWRTGSITDDEARFLDYFVGRGLLPVTLDALPEIVPLVAEYRDLEKDVPVPVRAPGLVAGDLNEQTLFVRGNHKRPAEPVARRFLEALGGTRYAPDSTGRRELARDLIAPDNPLTARVAVNRIWHWVFGRGIVPTTDNLGRLGELPSHPDLLDWLATRFVEDGWRTKRLIRLLVTSRTFRQSSVASKEARTKDPDNRLLARGSPRRLEAEAIRDALLAVSGRLDRTAFGPPADDASNRRSVYVRVRRNDLSPFLEVFDAPVPFTTTGRRAVTNVPAQSLALMNSRFVIESSDRWAERIARDPALSNDEQRIERMFLEALGRKARKREILDAQRFVSGAARRQKEIRQATTRLEGEIAERRARVTALLEAARARVLAARGEGTGRTEARLPQPIARWDFEDGLDDSIGEMHGKPVGRPRVENGQLILDGESYVATAPLLEDVREKTLEAWVELSGLEQRAGGVITLQTRDGVIFDSIVYAERESRRWMPGSNGFARTKDVRGVEETSTDLVHIAITYSADGTIRMYRDGAPYGHAYRSSGPVTFNAGRSQVLIGMRHGTPERRTARLRGAVDRAQLYDRALSDEEIAASASGDPNFVSRRDLLAALTPTERHQRELLEVEITARQLELEELREPGGDDPNRPWRALAQAMFNLKEFLFLP